MPDPSSISAVDAASAADRRWFAEHPDADCYVRPRIVGELGPREDDAPFDAYPWIVVTQLRPGVRTREPFAHVEWLCQS